MCCISTSCSPQINRWTPQLTSRSSGESSTFTFFEGIVAGIDQLRSTDGCAWPLALGPWRLAGMVLLCLSCISSILNCSQFNHHRYYQMESKIVPATTLLAGGVNIANVHQGNPYNPWISAHGIELSPIGCVSAPPAPVPALSASLYRLLAILCCVPSLVSAHPACPCLLYCALRVLFVLS